MSILDFIGGALWAVLWIGVLFACLWNVGAWIIDRLKLEPSQ